MNPIYLGSISAAKVLKVLRKHDRALFEELREKHKRGDAERAYALRAELELVDEELEIDRNPVVSVGDDGAWVLCWNYLSKTDEQ